MPTPVFLGGSDYIYYNNKPIKTNNNKPIKTNNNKPIKTNNINLKKIYGSNVQNIQNVVAFPNIKIFNMVITFLIILYIYCLFILLVNIVNSKTNIY